jgi:hypothetical protein
LCAIFGSAVTSGQLLFLSYRHYFTPAHPLRDAALLP